ncbi:hypothetical protein FBUS_03782 [Fasciolopsis buskii]|uniref:Uncharacterized protein n=1 Tax=Fasciolopsis buskii TaxID=27845 RepID=A0A8E0S8P8_9TREM|nr:hypothetical protein FBUS_03782 [Fasciolopsis buski]
MNEGDIEEQRGNLQKLRTEVTLLQEKSNDLAKEMSQLRTKEGQLVSENEKRIADLNRCLGTRAQRQTHLNELREAAHESWKKRDEALANLTRVNEELNKERIDKRRRIVKIDSDLPRIVFDTVFSFPNERPYNEALITWNNANAQAQSTSASLTKQLGMWHDLQCQQEQLKLEMDKINSELEAGNAQKRVQFIATTFHGFHVTNIILSSI